MSRNVHEVQRDFARSSGLRSEIIWDSLTAEQSEILCDKIKTILPITDKSRNATEKMRQNLFENIWKQRKYTNKTLLSAIIYVLVTDEKNVDLAKYSTKFSCHPVFRTRKCMADSNNSANCCMIFIDETGRIYNNWKAYLNNNVLPKGIMIAPLNGIYTFDDDEIQLEYHPTAASCTKSQIINKTDTYATVGGFMATVPIAAALAFPIAAPFMAAATAVAVSTAAYSTLRSAMQLVDRRKHGQSTALTDRAARGNWIGVAGGVVGLGATGATKALTCAATAGQEIALTTKLAVNGINVSSIFVSGTGVVNGVYDLVMKINDDEQLCGLDILQLASSLLVFTHSVNNFNVASKVAAYNRGSSIRQELNRQIGKMVHKISKHTSKLHAKSGKMDIIRTVNDIPFKDALMSLHKINTSVNNIKNNTIVSTTSMVNASNSDINIQYLAEEFGNKFVYHITNSNSILDVLNAMAKYFCEQTFRFLMILAKTFMEKYVDNLERVLNTFISTETVLFKILMHCISNYSTFTYLYLESKTAEILTAVDQYFASLNPVGNNILYRKCQQCNGKYYICDL